MSGRGSRYGYGECEQRGGPRRSTSPHDSRRGGYGGGRPQDSRYFGRESRGGHGGYDDRRGYGGGQSGGRGMPASHNLPTTVAVPESGRALTIPPLPVEGSDGRPTTVLVNHFELQSLPIVKSYIYNLNFKVPKSSQRQGKEAVSPAQLLTLMDQESVRQLLGENFVFDGVSLGWSVKELVPINSEVKRTIDLPSRRPDQLNQIDITMRNMGVLDIRTLVGYIMGRRIELDPMGNADIEPLLKWLNAVYRQDPASRWVTRPNANAYFERTPETSMPLKSTSNVLEAIRGIFQTVQIRFGKLTLNVDTATTAFWTPGKNLIELVHALAGVSMQRDIQSWYLEDSNRFIENCDRLVGIYFCLRHLSERQNARKRRFSKWTRGSAMDMDFEVEIQGQKQMITVNNYFRLKYNITLKYPKLPMAVVGDSWYPLELCWSAEGERFKEPLQGAETADFIKFATAPGHQRREQIMASVAKLGWHNLPTPKTFGLSVKPQMMQLDARLLPSPPPQYASGTDSRSPENGQWNLRGKQFLKPSGIKAWGLLYFPAGAGAPINALQEFSAAVLRSFRMLGMGVPRDEPAILKSNPHGDITQIIGEVMAKTKSKFGNKADLVMVLVHGASDRLYRAIKNVCEITFGVASQVMIIDKATNQRGQMQYLANIGLKVNVKLGGMNSTINEPIFRASRWMVLGGDTSHPSPAQLRMNPPPPTYSAVCGSWDPNCTLYTTVSSAQFSKEQTISDFAVMARELLKRYAEKNRGEYPQSILYYRDGLSESQFAAIMAEEVEPLREACLELAGGRVKITVVICIKRHHTRMFPTDRGDRLGNVLPGTVIENNGGKDIYLVAHSGLQGTVRPTRYAMLMDQNNLSATDFQRITNSICWNYARATRAVSIVPPVYYADQACERAKFHIREGPNGTQILGQVHAALRFTMYWQ